MNDPTYQCQRCGEATKGVNAFRRYCATCGVHEVELLAVHRPAAPVRDSGEAWAHHLPAAV